MARVEVWVDVRGDLWGMFGARKKLGWLVAALPARAQDSVMGSELRPRIVHETHADGRAV